MSDINDLMKLITVGIGDYNKYETAKLKIQQDNNTAIFNTFAKIEAENAKANYTNRYNVLTDEKKANEVAIKSLVDDISKWNISASEWSNLDDYYQTEEGQKILNDLGVEYGENFRFRQKIAADKDSQLNNTAGLISIQRNFIDHLENKRQEIQDLRPHLEHIRDEGIIGVHEKLDYINYINENPEIFAKRDLYGNYVRSDYGETFLPEGINPDNPLPDLEKLHKDRDKHKNLYETNQLANAWLKDKSKSTTGQEYGYYDAATVKAYINKSDSIAKESKEKFEKTDKQIWEADIGFLFDKINTVEKGFKTPAKKDYHEFIAINQGPLTPFADKKQYSNQHTAKKLYDEITRRIYNILNDETVSYGTMAHMEKKPGNIRSTIEALTGANINKQHAGLISLYNQFIPDANQMTKYGWKDEKRWATPQLAEIDLAGRNAKQDKEEEYLLWNIKAHKMLTERYPELALPGIKELSLLKGQSIDRANLLPSQVQELENKQTANIHSFIKNHEARLFRGGDDLDENRMLELDIYDLLEEYKGLYSQ